jgi:TRAP-type C4-dicarboxylate transport system permease small subunit
VFNTKNLKVRWKMKKIFNNIEMILGSMAISVTILSVIMNVFLRYGFGIQFIWVEEVSVGCFVWAVFLGATAAYKEKTLIGVEALTQMLPFKARRGLEIIVYTFLLVLNVTLCYLSFKYTAHSKKLTPGLEVSYAYINSSMIVSFGLMSLYSVKFLIDDVMLFVSELKERKN